MARPSHLTSVGMRKFAEHIRASSCSTLVKVFASIVFISVLYNKNPKINGEPTLFVYDSNNSFQIHNSKQANVKNVTKRSSASHLNKVERFFSPSSIPLLFLNASCAETRPPPPLPAASRGTVAFGTVNACFRTRSPTPVGQKNVLKRERCVRQRT